MAQRYGVTVKAYNISSEQIAYARRRAAQENLTDKVEFIQDDWRNIRGKYDAFVSVGMLEHVGLDNYRRLGDTIARSLHAGGRGLVHSIGQNFPRPFDRWTQRRIFPGAYPPTIAQMMSIFEQNRLSVLDVENLRLHYAETCRHWWDRYERAAEAVTKMFDKRFLRMWRLYLAASVVAFQVGNLQLFQVLFAPGCRTAFRERASINTAMRISCSARAPKQCCWGEPMEHCDVLIVGGGPAGSSCAGLCGRPDSMFSSSTRNCSRATKPAPAGSRPLYSTS